MKKTRKNFRGACHRFPIAVSPIVDMFIEDLCKKYKRSLSAMCELLIEEALVARGLMGETFHAPGDEERFQNRLAADRAKGKEGNIRTPRVKP